MAINLDGILSPFTALKQLAKKPHTVRYPYEKKEAAPRYRGMHYNDIETCIGCGSCATICQNEAIDMIELAQVKPDKGDSGLRPRVDNGRCCWCALCVDVCPTGSLQLSREYMLVSPDPGDFLFVPGVDHPEYGEKPGFVSEADGVHLLDFKRVPMREMEGSTRIRSFDEVVLGYAEEEAQREASRCVDCAICVTACPDHMHIPEYIKAIAEGDYAASVRYMYDNNPFAETCGKVCTRRCEDVCAISHRGDPVAIRWLKRFATERFDNIAAVVDTEPAPPTGQSVGIVGGGPAGLTAAYYLALRGYAVTVYEALPKAGGMLYAGIPKYRLPESSIIDKQIGFMESRGVKIQTNTRVGRDISFAELETIHDAVFLGVGFHVPYKLGLKGEDLPGSIQAVDFLREVNFGARVDIGKRVVVIGGGNVAIDAARVSRRLGAEVTILYRRRVEDMPADWEEIEGAEHEGVHLVTQGIPLEIIPGEDGKVKAIKWGRAEMISDGKGGRPRPKLIEGDENILEVDTVIGAIGQEADYSFLPPEIMDRVEFERGRIVTNKNGQTSLEWLFAGGDTVNRTADAISAIADGRRAVVGIDEYLTRKRSS